MRKNGIEIPAGLIRPTTAQPDPIENADSAEPAPAEPDGADPATAKATRGPKKRRTRADAGESRGRKLSLPDGVHFRLHLVALQRGKTASEVAAEILDRNLPKLRIERED